MKILVVDDNAANIRLLMSFFRRYEYNVISASNGSDAIALFKHSQPDLVLMDIMMPGMDGRDCASELKRLSGDRYIPIIYVTALSQEAALDTALASGGDDFVGKPINFDILISKIRAHSRIQELNTELIHKNTQLAKYTLSLERDQELASYYFTKALKHTYLDPDVIRYHLSSANAFNGDLLMAAPRPGGGLYVILGDFTGHGLGAAIGAVPVSQIFFKMAKEASWIGDIARTLNQELANLLPVDMFLAATLIEVSSTGERLALWAGGLPDAYLVDSHTQTHQIIKSMHLPLGILSDEKFNPTTEIYTANKGDRLYLYTDGLIEATNARGEIYGINRLHELFLTPESDVFEQVINNIQEFISPCKQADDISFVELTCQPVNILGSEHSPQVAPRQDTTIIPYHLSIRLTEKELKSEPDIISFLSEMICATTLAPYKGIIHTVLAEIYSNILEHGLLDLDSSQKSDDSGFSNYYEQKTQLLQTANNLILDIDITYEPGIPANRLIICLAHNGNSTRGITIAQENDINLMPYGRGMMLLNNLCDSVELSEDGRGIKAVYLA